MKENKIKIGLAFSGGGFRATSFSLGVLSFLNSIKLSDQSLLTRVVALSTISGGTITGTRYAIGIKKNESFEEIYSSLYKFMSQIDLIDLSLSELISKNEWSSKGINSLISAFADVYDKELFNQEKFGILLTDNNPIHLKHISFNATEFANALQFRFQRTEKIRNPKENEPDRGIIGNYYYRIPENIAKNIRMADILAASSCFPGGFEPINFPDDFSLPQSKENEDVFRNNNFPVGLMDGGIVDNQGIEPLLLTEDRMKRNRADSSDNDSNELDLLIISDVTSPYMEDFKASKKQKKSFLRTLSPQIIFIANSILLLCSLVGLFFSIKNGLLLSIIILSSLSTLNILLFIIATVIKKMPEKFQIPQAFMKPFTKLLKIKLGVYENLILNRTNSLLKMTNDVFLKHIRRLNYNKIYTDKSWKNRRIMNAIYELRFGEQKLQNKIKNQKINKSLIPSKALQEVATVAASMGTTLWFTKDELNKKNMLNSIIACGQFTMCWNLLEYIGKIKSNPENINESHNELIKSESIVLLYWEKFNKDPYWQVNEINNKTNF
ncbi:patatin-like phospholipase family protein [Labilibaculum sp. DW002]|uniref:Patatin-like phospholipase family protein n=1 Tax=Paralabilibaculum antarcticum TaxID=2912572 RepID=A0ABT5VT69_9BACT|nr:patatin-like phospholipase family protein [Labilibaculum sp. DW002]MDE5418455.1 patatin-like phospholipase family protein [Labilibaculum sp. DW002]